jgi:DNA-binding NtrC family response regulator
MQEVFRAIGRLSQSSATVLITGESGTGKELVARALHRHSPRAPGPFIAINTAAIPKDLLESELFGHERGAFTGAQSARRGRFEQAEGGTLFLDEIGDVDLQIQPKLLKVLEEGRFRRLGEVRDRTARVRLIAATHQNLAELVAQKRFREDLFYRINTIPLRLPALRERAEDIPALAEQFLSRISADLGRRPPALSPAARRRLQAHSWPGNIRELRNVLERAVLLDQSEVLDTEALGLEAGAVHAQVVPVGLTTLKEAERLLIERMLGEEHGNIERSASRLGISRSSLYQRIQRHRITVSRI